MKAITLWQPWASLLAIGAKRYETRSWETNHRGLIAIHAAKLDIAVATWGFKHPVCDVASRTLGLTVLDFSELQRGCVIATAELVGCHKIIPHGGRGLSSTATGLIETETGLYEPTESELLFGDWTPGRYAWEFKNMRILDDPIPARGGQRLWNWEI